MRATVDDIEEHLGVGKPAMLQIEPLHRDGQRFATNILGWKKGRSVLIEPPKTLDGREAIIRETQPCVLRFVHEGNACAFSSVISGRIGARGYGQVCLCWPERVERQPLRRYDRVPILAPCSIERRDGEVSVGRLKDLSLGGCGLIASGQIAKDESISVSFALPEGTEVAGLGMVVRAANPGMEGMFLGCEFEPGQERAKNSICLFVSMELARGRHGHQESAPARRVLIVDSMVASFEELKAALARENFEAYGASSTVDAMYALRAMPFHAVAISHEMPELPGLEMCRLIRGASGLDNLLVLLYGGDASVAQAASQMGLYKWLPASKTLVSDLAAALGQVLQAESVAV